MKREATIWNVKIYRIFVKLIMKDIPSFNLQCRLTGNSEVSFKLLFSNFLSKRWNMKKLRILRKNLDNLHILSRVYYKQSLPPEFSHMIWGSKLMSTCYGPRTRQNWFYGLNRKFILLTWKSKRGALSGTNSTEGFDKSNSSSESVSGAGNWRTNLLVLGCFQFLWFFMLL